jgi:signal transduction histidine kinase
MSVDVLDQTKWVHVRPSDRALSSLDQISRALTTMTEGVDVLLQTLAQTIAEVFDSSFVLIVVKSGYKQRRAVFLAGGDEESTSRTELLEHIPCLNEQVLSEQGLVEVNRLPPVHRPCQALGAIVSAPMLREGKPEGRICLQTDGVGRLTENDAAMLRTLANRAAVAVQNARMFEESLYLRAQTEELYRIAVQQKNEAERRQVELQAAQDEIDSMEREQIISSERERIARELHDDVAQILISIGLNLEWCRQQLPTESLVQERLALLKQLARNGLFEIRNTILGLSSINISEVGLTSALAKLAADFEKISRISAEFHVEGESRPLPHGVGNALYYIAQEALYNVFKHAHAQHVEVRLLFEPEAAALTVTDDGVGIAKRDEEEGRRSVTFGIKNMLRRAEELGGSVLIGMGETAGTRITARIPG